MTALHPPVDDISTALSLAADALSPTAPRPLDAVAWISAHVAAHRRTVGAAARTATPAETAVANVTAQRLLTATRRLEQVGAGDALAAGLDARGVRAEVLAALAAHRAAEHVLLARLTDVLSAGTLDALVSAYLHAFRTAPTRPHVHAPRHGPLAATAFRLDAALDRVLDVMDGRHVPMQRARPQPRPAGRWGRYLMGG